MPDFLYKINKPMAKSNKNRKLAMMFILLSIVWVSFLFAESSSPPNKIINSIFGLDKIAHFIAFGILALLIWAAKISYCGKSSLPVFSTPLGIVMLAGTIEEGYQMTIPGRTAGFEDLVADISGGLFVVALANFVFRIKFSQRCIKVD